MWLNVTERKKEHAVDYGYTWLEFLPVGIAELEVKDEDLDLDNRVFFYEPTSSGVMPLEDFIPFTHTEPPF